MTKDSPRLVYGSLFCGEFIDINVIASVHTHAVHCQDCLIRQSKQQYSAQCVFGVSGMCTTSNLPLEQENIWYPWSYLRCLLFELIPPHNNLLHFIQSYDWELVRLRNIPPFPSFLLNWFALYLDSEKVMIRLGTENCHEHMPTYGPWWWLWSVHHYRGKQQGSCTQASPATYKCHYASTWNILFFSLQ